VTNTSTVHPPPTAAKDYHTDADSVLELGKAAATIEELETRLKQQQQQDELELANATNIKFAVQTEGLEIGALRARLTIAVDHGGSCPDNCVFVHKLLPPWLFYRYISFPTVESLEQIMTQDYQDDADAGNSHYLIVARDRFSQIGSVARRFRTEHPNTSIGVWRMADELLTHAPNYSDFDYKIRHYFAHKEKGGGFRALGNYTCGSSPPLPSNKSTKAEPKWGVHWAFLEFEKKIANFRDPTSSWPISHRSSNCSFIGRSTPERVAILSQVQKADLNCNIQFTSGFGKGNGEFKYMTEDIGGTKIGLNPTGNNVECIRLNELLSMGTVPAMIDQKFVHATFEPLPAILGKDWSEVVLEMKRLIDDEKNGGKELDALARRGSEWKVKLNHCMKSDMDFILKHSFGIA
jgi:hypothetical protein